MSTFKKVVIWELEAVEYCEKDFSAIREAFAELKLCQQSVERTAQLMKKWIHSVEDNMMFRDKRSVSATTLAKLGLHQPPVHSSRSYHREPELAREQKRQRGNIKHKNFDIQAREHMSAPESPSLRSTITKLVIYVSLALLMFHLDN